MADPDGHLTFHVTLTEESSGRMLFVVGDCPELGHWKPNLAMPLQLVSKSSECEVWVGSYSIAADSIQYRFFLGSVQEITTEEIVIVHSWETLPEPRCLRGVRSGTNEIAHTYGHLNGDTYLGRGWLTGQTAIRLSLHNNALRFFPSVSSAERYLVRCLPIDTGVSNGGGAEVRDTNDNRSTIATDTYVSILNDRCASCRPLPCDGVEYRASDFMTFRVETWSPERLAFKIVVSGEWSDNESSSNGKFLKEIGAAFVEPLDVACSKKFITASILSKDGEIVGHIKIDLLVIRSLDYPCDMSTSVSRFERPCPDRAWFIGHRGMGRTIKNGVQSAGPGTKENTISSLTQAVGHGADFVEFDVMLSRDRIPVLHHDFLTSISARGKLNGVERQIAIPVQHLDLKDLESLQTPAATGCTLSEGIRGTDEEHDLENQPFPLLRSCLEKVDSRAGFNVEVKYCMRLRSGDLEEGMAHFPDRNDYVDDILRELLRHGGGRKIILSSFDPDVCVMMHEKQNRIPVLFLTQGETKKYPQYEDSRTWDAETAIQFAVAESLRGVCVHTESLLKEPVLIERGKTRGLWMICWGDDNSSKENVRFLMDRGADGIILDRIDEFIIR